MPCRVAHPTPAAKSHLSEHPPILTDHTARSGWSARLPWFTCLSPADQALFNEQVPDVSGDGRSFLGHVTRLGMPSSGQTLSCVDFYPGI